MRPDAIGTLFYNLTYALYDSPKKTNRLREITDAQITTSSHPNDLETQGANDYVYDEIGNLIEDQGADWRSRRR